MGMGIWGMGLGLWADLAGFFQVLWSRGRQQALGPAFFAFGGEAFYQKC